MTKFWGWVKSTLQQKTICCMNRGPMQHGFWVTVSCRLQEILEVSTWNTTKVNLQLESLFMPVIQLTNSSLFHLKHQTGEMFEYTYAVKANCILCSAKLTAMNIKQVYVLRIFPYCHILEQKIVLPLTDGKGKSVHLICSHMTLSNYEQC
jgi:hypothetical protein